MGNVSEATGINPLGISAKYLDGESNLQLASRTRIKQSLPSNWKDFLLKLGEANALSVICRDYLGQQLSFSYRAWTSSSVFQEVLINYYDPERFIILVSSSTDFEIYDYQEHEESFRNATTSSSKDKVRTTSLHGFTYMLLSLHDLWQSVQMIDRAKASILIEAEQGRENECPVCLDQLIDSVLPCGHGFCSDCAKSWINSGKTCPLCRAGAAKGDSDNWVLTNGSCEQDAYAHFRFEIERIQKFYKSLPLFRDYVRTRKWLVKEGQDDENMDNEIISQSLFSASNKMLKGAVDEVVAASTSFVNNNLNSKSNNNEKKTTGASSLNNTTRTFTKLHSQDDQGEQEHDIWGEEENTMEGSNESFYKEEHTNNNNNNNNNNAKYTINGRDDVDFEEELKLAIALSASEIKTALNS